MLVPRGTGQPWWKPCLALPWRRGLWGDLASVRQTLVGRSGGVDLTKRQRRLKLSISHGRAGAGRGGWRLVVESMFHETFLQAHQLHPVVSG
jgi:hypothetical protein